MPFEDSVKEKIKLVLQKSSTFNNTFNNRVRQLPVSYCDKISFVLSGGASYRYPCDESCTIFPRKLITKFKGGVFLEGPDGKEDERCCSCDKPLDIKYMNLDQLWTYQGKRPEELKIIDFEKHPENGPLYAILDSGFVPPEEMKKMEMLFETVKVV